MTWGTINEKFQLILECRNKSFTLDLETTIPYLVLISNSLNLFTFKMFTNTELSIISIMCLLILPITKNDIRHWESNPGILLSDQVHNESKRLEFIYQCRTLLSKHSIFILLEAFIFLSTYNHFFRKFYCHSKKQISLPILFLMLHESLFLDVIYFLLQAVHHWCL